MSEGMATQNVSMIERDRPNQADEYEELEGLEEKKASWGDYPIDDFLIRSENRSINEIIRRIREGRYIMDPDFQRDFIWDEKKQSRLIESVLLRIPLPVFYMAEDEEGRMVVVDGLQRLSTFRRFIEGGLQLRLPDRIELHRKGFSDLSPKWQNRVEDCNLTFYIIDSKAPDRARLDIFERVNGGEPLTRQQMRNCLYMGQATRFLKDETKTDIFREATGGNLNWKKMRDRELVNRFCAFQLLDLAKYEGDMDSFLAECLENMNRISANDLNNLSMQFRRGLSNNCFLFKRHAFRKHTPDQERRSVLNASLWDVMSTGLSRYAEDRVRTCAIPLRCAVYELLKDENFNIAISYGPNDSRKVRTRFQMSREKFREILGAHTD